MSNRLKKQRIVQQVEEQNMNNRQIVVKLKIEPLKEEWTANSNFKQQTYLYDEADDDQLSSAKDYLMESIDFLDQCHSDENPNDSDPRRRVKTRRKYTFCSTCDKFVRNFEEHRRMHLDIRLQKCPYCDKSFVHRSNFYTHLNIHTRKRSYKCDLCSSEFNSPQGLNQHRARHLDNKYECLECGKKFVRKSYLRTHHQRVHVPRTRHSCLICDKSFLNATQVEKHMEIHNNEDLFGCEVCQRAYKAKKNLSRHMRMAHPECVELYDPS